MKKLENYDNETKRMSFVFYVALFLAAVASSQACSCMTQHPQEAFCRAHFGKLQTIHWTDYSGGKLHDAVVS